jgi:hypothetical protein
VYRGADFVAEFQVIIEIDYIGALYQYQVKSAFPELSGFERSAWNGQISNKTALR